MANINCVDLSSWQSGVNFATLKKQGVQYVILRVGFGNYTKDSRFEEHYAGAKSQNLKIGAYWYSKAHNESDAIAEAKACIKLIDGKKMDLPIYFDMEESWQTCSVLGKAKLTKMVEAFCDTVIAKGYKGGVYSNYTGFTYDLDYSKLRQKYSIWLAYYQPAPCYECDVWQNSDKGQIAGVNGNVDTNTFYGANTILISTSKPKTQTIKNKVVLPSVKYRVRVNGKWLDEVTDLSDYAGISGRPITDIAIKPTKGSIKYRVHISGGRWLPYVTGYNITDDTNGYAGDKKPIDAIQVYYTTPADVVKGAGYLRAKYRVSPSFSNDYYSWQYDDETTNNQDGYAGSYGIYIDKFQLVLSK